MRSGRQWLALDVFFFGKPFPIKLKERFGLAGVCVYLAFLCACKRNHPQGEISFMGTAGALQEMRVDGWPLVDDQGHEWTLDEFWAFTGRMKQTRKTSRGHVTNVKSTHFERWQETVQRDQAAERQRRSRARNDRDEMRDNERDRGVTNTVTDLDSDLDTPLPPKGGGRRRFASNGNSNGQTPAGRPVADWKPEDAPADVIDPKAVSNLRANLGGGGT